MALIGNFAGDGAKPNRQANETGRLRHRSKYTSIFLMTGRVWMGK